MCRQFTQMMSWSELYELLDGKITNRIELQKLSNVAPTMTVLVALPEKDAYLLRVCRGSGFAH